MGIFDWITKRSPFQATINMVVKNAVKQYKNIKEDDESIVGDEIASNIWYLRYMGAKLSNKSEIRWRKYVEEEFEIKNMVDFCLSSIDIEFLVDPRNELHDLVGSKVVEGLEKNGVPSKIEDVREFQDRWFMVQMERGACGKR